MRNGQELVESLLSFCGLQKLEISSSSGTTEQQCKEFASAIPSHGRDYSSFHTAVGNLIFMATQVCELTTGSKCATKQLLRYLRGNACPRLEAHATVQENTIELVGRSDSGLCWRLSNTPTDHRLSL